MVGAVSVTNILQKIANTTATFNLELPTHHASIPMDGLPVALSGAGEPPGLDRSKHSLVSAAVFHREATSWRLRMPLRHEPQSNDISSDRHEQLIVEQTDHTSSNRQRVGFSTRTRRISVDVAPMPDRSNGILPTWNHAHWLNEEMVAHAARCAADGVACYNNGTCQARLTVRTARYETDS